MSNNSLEEIAGHIKPRSASNLLLWAILAFFALVVLWAVFTQIDRTVHGAGRVVPTAQLQVVSNLEGGVVSAIMVKPGMQVKAGMPLIRLDATATGAELGANQSSLDSLRAKVARLEAEISGRSPTFPVSTDASANEQIAIERALYRSRQSDLAALNATGAARLAQAERAVAEAEAGLIGATTSRDSAQQQADMIRPLVANGIEPRLSLVQADRAASVAASQTSQAAAALARARSSVAEARASAAQLRQEWLAKSGTELAATQAELVGRLKLLPALSDKVKRTTVRAPLSGLVNRVMVATVGGTVRPGEPLVEMVPAEQGLTIVTMVKPDDIAFVRTHQRALVKISAYDYAVYGGLEGEVVGISPDSTVEEKTGQAFYTVRVRTRGVLRDQAGQKLEVGPGMVADVNLIGDKRSIMSYLLTPITRLRDDAFRER